MGSKQIKNMVSSSSECHQVNPLTSFSSTISGQADRLRTLGSVPSSSSSVQLPGHTSARGQLEQDVKHFYESSGSSMMTPSGWVDEFARIPQNASYHPHPGPMVMSRPPMPHHMMGFMPPPPMMMYGRAPEVAPSSAAATSSSKPPLSVNDDLAAAKRMVEMLRNSGNPKFANSTFVDFIDQVASGDLRLREGEVVDRSGQAVDWDDVYGSTSEEQDYTSPLGELLSAGDDVENFPDQMDRIWNELRGDNAFLTASPSVPEYTFLHAQNEYIESENPLEVAIRLMKQGQDLEAIKALEAEVRVNSNSSEGWRLLGQLHAQFDRDVEAIKCLEKGHECDAFNLDSMLALGVSLTNELDSIRAMGILKKWIACNEKYHMLTPTSSVNDPGVADYDFTQLKREVLDLFTQAANLDPEDADVTVALGVLHNINRSFALATESLVRAVRLRPSDFTAWNKLGATLANAGLSEDALLCYHQALALKPNYARAWSNLAIAHSNLGEFDKASRFYLTALQLTPNATHLWTSLVVSLSNWQPENAALSDLLEQRDLASLVKAVPGTPTVDSLPPPQTMPANTEGVLEKIIGVVKNI